MSESDATVRLEDSWKRRLSDEFSKPYMLELKKFLKAEKANGKSIFPKMSLIFNALNTTPFEKVKAVILGQDPYHGPGQAHGLCFSVPEGVAIPPSLLNIFQELRSDLKIEKPRHGNLTSWALQGVLLLNTVLTVEKSKAGSHHGKGWEIFTDQIIKLLDDRTDPLVFILWGSPAQKKESLLKNKNHLVLKAVHPSPLSAYRGFFGCRHFSKTNEFLKQAGKPEINWSLP
ncbi:MAG: uracil-DNA glycosylase [Oligoflexia bacterium]|nr:uracil-DNA glycosylase [Oligoflexia bacterium]